MLCVISAGDGETAYQMLASSRPTRSCSTSTCRRCPDWRCYLAIYQPLRPTLEGRIALMSATPTPRTWPPWIEHHHCVVLRKPFDVKDVGRWVRGRHPLPQPPHEQRLIA